MPITKEQLLVEVEDLLRTAPPITEIMGNTQRGVAWLGRFSAVIRAWDGNRAAEVLLCQMQLESHLGVAVDNGIRRILTLLNEARSALQMATGGPLSVSVDHGRVFDYFDEVRKVIEMAQQDLLFVDPYLDVDFVSRYLCHVKPGATVRLIARKKLPPLLPALN